MSNSMTPFLYQTRTLSTATRTKIRSLHNTKYGYLMPKPFSCAAQRPYIDNHVNRPKQSRALDSQGSKIRRVITPDPKSRDNSEIKSADKGIPRRPFVGRTNSYRDTLEETRNNGGAESGREFDAEGINDVYSRRSEDIEFDEVPGTDGYALSRDEIADLTRSSSLRESTITDTERYAFQKIFSDIFGRHQRVGSELQSSDGKVASSVAGALHKPDDILSDGMKTQRQPETRREMQILVNKFPVALRAAAAKAIGLTDADAAEADFNDPMAPGLDNQNLEALREPERTRVEGLMKAAKTDFELWEIMKQEVFSLIPKLGLGDPLNLTNQTPEAAATAPTSKTSQKKQKNKESVNAKLTNNTRTTKSLAETENLPADTATAASPTSISEDGVSPLALYGPLYPSYLLLGIRLLDRSFSKSSPLTLSILPTIKSLGLISQVLGASTPLYNELIRIHQRRHEDYRSILKLLHEMENSGLEFDEETYDIVREIHGTQYRVRHGLEGAAMQALWGLPEFAPNKFRIWTDKIGAAIEEKTEHGQM